MPAGAAEDKTTEATPGRSTAARLAEISGTQPIIAQVLPLVLLAAHQRPAHLLLTTTRSDLMRLLLP